MIVHTIGDSYIGVSTFKAVFGMRSTEQRKRTEVKYLTSALKHTERYTLYIGA